MNGVNMTFFLLSLILFYYNNLSLVADEIITIGRFPPSLLDIQGPAPACLHQTSPLVAPPLLPLRPLHPSYSPPADHFTAAGH